MVESFYRETYIRLLQLWTLEGPIQLPATCQFWFEYPQFSRRVECAPLFEYWLRVNFFKSRTAKIDIPHIKHGETTSHQHHFFQRDYGSIYYHFSSRLIPFFYFRNQKKIEIVYKTLNSRAILLKIGMMIEPGQENFLMPWVWKYLCTMDQKSIFYEKF